MVDSVPLVLRSEKCEAVSHCMLGPAVRLHRLPLTLHRQPCSEDTKLLVYTVRCAMEASSIGTGGSSFQLGLSYYLVNICSFPFSRETGGWGLLLGALPCSIICLYLNGTFYLDYIIFCNCVDIMRHDFLIIRYLEKQK